MKSRFVVTLCIGVVTAATVLLAEVQRNDERPSEEAARLVAEGASDRDGRTGGDSSVGKASEGVPRRILEAVDSTNSVKEKSGSQSQSEGENLRIPRVGERIGDDMKKAYATELLAAGFQEDIHGTYIAGGLTVETVKKVIRFDDAIGQMHEPGCLAEGEKKIVLEMPFITAGFEYSTIGTTNSTRTVILIRERAVDAKAKPEGANLKKEPHLHGKKPGGTGQRVVDKAAVP